MPHRQSLTPPEDLFDIGEYITEVLVPSDSSAVGKTIYEIEVMEDQETGGVTVLDIVRNGHRIPAPPAYQVLQANDVLVLEIASQTLALLLETTGLELLESKQIGKAKAEGDEEEVTM